MSKQQPVIDFLTQLAASAMMVPDEEGQLLHQVPGSKKKSPVLVAMEKEGKIRKYPLYLPTIKLQRDADPGKIAFFPLCESIWNKNSEVLNLLIRNLGMRIHGVTLATIINLLKIKLDAEAGPKCGNKVTEILTKIKIKKTQQRELLRFIKKAQSAKATGPSALARIVVSRDVPKSIGGTRIAFLALANTDNDKLLGSNPDQQTRDLVENMLELIFGDLEQYLCASARKSAPSLYSLLKAFASVADRLNEIHRDMGIYREEANIIEDEWFDLAADEDTLDKFHSELIQVKFPGNVGEPSTKSQNQEAAEPMARNFSVKTDKTLGTEQVQETVSEGGIIRPASQVQEQEEVQQVAGPGGFRPGGAKFDASQGTDISGNPAGQSFNQMLQNQQNQQQTVGGVVRPMNTVGGPTNIVTQGPQTSVVAPKQRIAVQRFQLQDSAGNLLTWQSGEAFEVEGIKPTVEFYWAANNQGQPMFLNSGEPILVDKNGNQLSAEQILSGTTGMGSTGGMNNQLGQNIPRKYTAQEMNNMSFNDRLAAQKHNQEVDEMMNNNGMVGNSLNGGMNQGNPLMGGGNRLSNQNNLLSQPQNRLGQGVKSFGVSLGNSNTTSLNSTRLSSGGIKRFG